MLTLGGAAGLLLGALHATPPSPSPRVWAQAGALSLRVPPHPLLEKNGPHVEEPKILYVGAHIVGAQ